MLGGASLTCEKCPICGVELDPKEYVEHLKLHVEDFMSNLLQADDFIGDDQFVCKDVEAGARFKSVIEYLKRNLLQADDSIGDDQFLCKDVEAGARFKSVIEYLKRNLLQANDSIGDDQFLCKDVVAGARFKSVIEDFRRSLLEADDSIREPQFVCPECNRYKSSRKMVLLHLENCKEDLEAGLDIISLLDVPNAVQQYDAVISRRKFAISNRAPRTKLELARLKIQKNRLRAAHATTCTGGYSGVTGDPEIDKAWAEIRESDKSGGCSNMKKAKKVSAYRKDSQVVNGTSDGEAKKTFDGEGSTSKKAIEKVTESDGEFDGSEGVQTAKKAIVSDGESDVSTAKKAGESDGDGSEADNAREFDKLENGGCSNMKKAKNASVYRKDSQVVNGTSDGEAKKTFDGEAKKTFDGEGSTSKKAIEKVTESDGEFDGSEGVQTAKKAVVSDGESHVSTAKKAGESDGDGSEADKFDKLENSEAKWACDGQGTEALKQKAKKASHRFPSNIQITGRKGERVAFNYFSSYLSNKTVIWVNEFNESGKPYDILVEDGNKNREFIEVKSTLQSKKDWFFISLNEFDFARQKGESYLVAHVVLAHHRPPRITVYRNPVKSGKLKMALHPRK